MIGAVNTCSGAMSSPMLLDLVREAELGDEEDGGLPSATDELAADLKTCEESPRWSVADQILDAG